MTATLPASILALPASPFAVRVVEAVFAYAPNGARVFNEGARVRWSVTIALEVSADGSVEYWYPMAFASQAEADELAARVRAAGRFTPSRWVEVVQAYEDERYSPYL